jgi:hypothetical protein
MLSLAACKQYISAVSYYRSSVILLFNVEYQGSRHQILQTQAAVKGEAEKLAC